MLWECRNVFPFRFFREYLTITINEVEAKQHFSDLRQNLLITYGLCYLFKIITSAYLALYPC